MHRRVNILQYVKTPFGRWQWEPMPRNRRTRSYIWSKAKSTHFYIVEKPTFRAEWMVSECAVTRPELRIDPARSSIECRRLQMHSAKRNN